MFKWILVASLNLAVGNALAIQARPAPIDEGILAKIEMALASGYSVAECRNGECFDYESGEEILIEDYDKDGYYLYWDEEKPNRGHAGAGSK